ncbi:lipoate--protein ligase family protein [Candidatus Woesearchaeota archaeon]|nr:lipoate--protein ligase family protein [Candidatus Woesearchaeota archaeon]
MFRIIGIEKHSAQMNMAIDYALYESVLKGASPPVIRFYKWEHGGVSIGKGQSPGIVNLKNCSDDRVGFVRRQTGGNALFHNGEDFTYSVIAPNIIFNGISGTDNAKAQVNIPAYKEICSWIIAAIEKIGLKAYLHGSNNVMVDGKKIAGSAQYNGGRVFLQHGSIFFSDKTGLWARYLNFPPEKMKDIIGINALIKANPSVLYQALIGSFSSNAIVKSAGPDKLSLDELRRAHDLVASEYSEEKFFGSGSERKGDVCAVDFERNI